VIQAVLFDIDDTLVDTSKAFEEAISGVRREYFPNLPESVEPEMLAVWYADSQGQLAKYIAGEIDILTQRVNRANELNQKFGGEPVTRENYPRWEEAFWGTFYRSMQAHDDVTPVLEKLQQMGIKLGVVTNAATEIQIKKLANAGIDAQETFAPAFVGVDTLGFGKPDPRVFLEACRALNVAPENTMYVGDEPDSDALAAEAAGLKGVWLTRHGAHRPTHFLSGEMDPKFADIVRIDSLTELLDLVKA